jgi:hypothetical protein
LAAVGFPFTTALVNAIAALVLFVKVTVIAALVLGMTTVPKFRLVGDTTSVGISVSFATKAADLSPLGRLVWNAGVVAVAGGKIGKVAAEENATPVIKASFAVSIAMPLMSSAPLALPLPPKKVE